MLLDMLWVLWGSAVGGNGGQRHPKLLSGLDSPHSGRCCAACEPAGADPSSPIGVAGAYVGAMGKPPLALCCGAPASPGLRMQPCFCPPCLGVGCPTSIVPHSRRSKFSSFVCFLREAGALRFVLQRISPHSLQGAPTLCALPVWGLGSVLEVSGVQPGAADRRPTQGKGVTKAGQFTAGPSVRRGGERRLRTGSMALPWQPWPPWRRNQIFWGGGRKDEMRNDSGNGKSRRCGMKPATDGSRLQGIIPSNYTKHHFPFAG